MKPFRWMYCSFMALALIAGIYSGFRVFYIIFFTQFLMVAAVLAISLWTVYTFRFKQELSVKTCAKGKEAFLHLEIANEKPIPLSLIEVHVDVVSYRENINLVFSLAPYSGKTFRIPVVTPYRGRYKVGMTKLKITDIFGLTSFPFDMRRLSYYRMKELVVLPKARIPGTVSADIEDTKYFGDPYLKQAETGDTVSGARLFHEGDALRRVHWKKSAQQGELFVKQFEYPERERVMMLVDTAAHGLSGEDLLVYADTVCECASSIALHSLTQNRLVYIMNSADFGMPIECDALSGLENIRRHLALLPFDEKADLSGTLSKSSHGYEQAYALFVLTRGAEPAYMQAIERMLSSYRSVTLVIVGGPKPGGRIHTLYVEPGTEAADSLSGLFT